MPSTFCRFAQALCARCTGVRFAGSYLRLQVGSAAATGGGKALPLSADRGSGQIVLDVLLRALGLLAQGRRQQVAQALGGVL